MIGERARRFMMMMMMRRRRARTRRKGEARARRKREPARGREVWMMFGLWGRSGKDGCRSQGGDAEGEDGGELHIGLLSVYWLNLNGEIYEERALLSSDMKRDFFWKNMWKYVLERMSVGRRSELDRAKEKRSYRRRKRC